MNTSRRASNGKPRWYRRGHRWLGTTIVAFVLFIAITGIALNHTDDLELNKKHVGWSWLLDAYGVDVPPPTASFADAGHQATLLGERLFVDGRDSGQVAATLAGIAVIDSLIIVAADKTVFLFMSDGALVEAIDLTTILSGPIDRVGTIAAGRFVLDSGERLYGSDADIAWFTPLPADTAVEVHWSSATDLDQTAIDALETAYRGRGLTVERVLLDLHSGRILALPGKVLLDIIGIGMILLSISGIALSRVRSRRENGRRQNNGRD